MMRPLSVQPRKPACSRGFRAPPQLRDKCRGLLAEQEGNDFTILYLDIYHFLMIYFSNIPLIISRISAFEWANFIHKAA
jgi:hypothetical protein